MKILLVTMEYPPFRGGVGNYYFNLVNNLRDFEIEVLVNLKLKTKNLKLKTQSCRIYSTKFFYSFFWPRWLKLFFEVKKIVKQNRPDIIWVGQVLPVGEAVYLIKKFFMIPYFVSTHGMDIMLPQKTVRKQTVMMKVLNNAEFITANSRFTMGQLLKLGINENKVEVVYPCCHVSRSTYHVSNAKINELREKLNLKDKKVLLTVGRLVERKGQDMVIKIMPRLFEKFPNLVYLMIGDGPMKSNFEFRISNFEIADNVKILDNVSDDELPTYYELADIFVMPSRDIKGDVEGFGIVYLEANSFGLPVIAGKSGGVMEAVIDGQTGLLVDPEDEDDIYEKIIKLLSDKDLYQKLSEGGKVRVEKEFQWERQSKKLLDRFKNIDL